MAKIVMSRVDFRLVHGQVASRWAKLFATDKIVVIDDETANDKFVSQVLKLASPAGAKVTIYTIDNAVQKWQETKFGSGKAIIIFKSVDGVKEAFDKGLTIESLNVGQVPSTSNRRNANNTVYLSDDELEKLIEMQEKGCTVYFQPIPDEPKVSLNDVVKKMKG